jgi:hypothetical protein
LGKVLNDLINEKGPPAPKMKKVASQAREALMKQKSRKDIQPGVKLTIDQIKNFDEN